jgi:hypothetical protein
LKVGAPSGGEDDLIYQIDFAAGMARRQNPGTFS